MASSLSMVFELLAIDRASAVFQRVGDVAGESATKVEAATAATGTAGSKIAAGLGVATGAVAAYSVKMAADFQTNVTKLTTTAGELPKNLQMVSSGMLEMAGQVGISAVELAKGMYVVESGGNHGAAGLTVLKAAAQGAKQEGADLTKVADALTTVLHDYNLPTSAAADTTSKLVDTVAHGKTTFDELTGSLHSVTPIAAALHIPLSDLLGDIAAMTASGMSADQVTQNVADSLRHLQSPTSIMTNELAQLNINSADLAGQLGTKGLSGVMQEISDAIIQHMDPAAQKVLIPALNQSKAAAQDMTVMIGQMPPTLAKMSQGLLDGSVSMGAYRKGVQGMGGDAGAMGNQFLSLYKSADGFNSLLKSGSPAAQEYSSALYKATGDASSLSVALQLTGEHTAATNQTIKDIAGSTAQADGSIKGWSEVQGNFNQQLAQAGAALQSMAIQAGQHLLPVLTDFLHFVNGTVLPGLKSLGGMAMDAAKWWSQLPQPIKDVSEALALLRIADMIGVFDKLNAGVGNVRSAFQRFRDEMQLQRALYSAQSAGLSDVERALGGIGTATPAAESGLSRVGVAASTAAKTGLAAFKAGASGLMDAFGGPWGAAVVGATAAVGLWTAAAQQAKDKENQWTDALKQGGAAMDRAKAQMQEMTAQTKELDSGWKGFAQSTVPGLKVAVDNMTPSAKAAAKAYDDWYKSLSPVDKANQDVTLSAAKLDEQIHKYGPTSGQAKDAADAYQAALGRQKTTQDQLNDAEKTHLQRLQDVANQQLSAVNASLAAQQADMQLANAVAQYNRDAKDGQHSTSQLALEQNNLAQQVISTAQATGQAAAAQSKSKDQTVLAQLSNQAMLKSLQDNAQYLTGPARDAVNKQIQILQATAIQTGNLGDAMDKMGLKTVGNMQNNSVVVKSATDAQIRDLQDLGYQVTHLPNGHIVVTSDTSPARQAIAGLLGAMATLPVVGGFASTALAVAQILHKATGGAITGPGTGTSDSILAALSNGEHVWTAKEVQAAGGHKAVESMRASVLSAGHGYAAGGPVDQAGTFIVDEAPQHLAGLKSALSFTSAGGNPANKALGQRIANAMGYGGQFNAIDYVFSHESGWNNMAQNPTSTAFGIPQFLNATWAHYGGKTTDPAAQILAGLEYMRDRYGSPAGAAAFWQKNHWYDNGGWLMPGATMAMNGTGKPERVRTAEQEAALQSQLSGSQTITLQLDGDAVTDLLEGRVVTALSMQHDRVAY